MSARAQRNPRYVERFLAKRRWNFCGRVRAPPLRCGQCPIERRTTHSPGMRIAFFGSSLVSSYWNGAATYYRGLLRALSRRGHDITFYEPDAFDRQSHRDLADPPWARVVV